MADNKDFEFRIRAKDYSQKTLGQVVETLKDLVKAQDDQLAAAKRGEAGSRALEETYRRLGTSIESLSAAGGLTKTFEAQTESLGKANVALETARTEQEAYAKSLAGVTKLTAEQASKQTQLAKAAKRAENLQQSAINNLEQTTQKLKSYGIAVDDIAGAQAQLAAAISTGVAAYERQDAALQSLDADVRKHKETVAAAAAEEKRAAAVQQQITDQLAQRAAEEVRLANIVEASKRKLLAAAKQQLAVDEADQVAAAKRRADAQRERAALEAQRVALTRVADQAIATANGYHTLARSIKEIRGDNLSATISGIQDPAAAALKSMSGLGDAISAVEKRISAIKGPISDYTATLKQLEAAQKQISATAGQVDGYRRQIDALRAAREEYVKARDKARELAEQMRAGMGGADIANQLARAQAALKATAKEMQVQTGRAREMRNELRQAGVDTSKLVQAEATLVSQSKRATSAINDLSAAFRKHGTATREATKWWEAFNKGQRTTLGYTQRLKGELLAYATAFVGVQAAVNLAGGAIDAFKSKQQILSRLQVASGGDSRAAAAEYEYLAGQAERIGFNFQKSAGAYAKFLIAAKSGNVSLQDSRFIFEQFATASVNAGLSTEDFEGSLKALEQMLSKGKIQAEELRGQLGDRLPGALVIAAKGVGVTVEQFSKMLELGEVSSDYVINIAREMGKTYSNVDSAMTSVIRAENAFAKAAFDFKVTLAEGGFIEAYTEFLTKLTALLKSDEGKKLAQTLSDGFTLVIKVLQFAAENIELVKAAFYLLAGGAVVKLIGSMVGVLMTMAGAVRGAYVAVKPLLAALPAIGAALTRVGAALGIGASAAGVMSTAVTALGVALKTLLRFVPFLGAALLAYDAYKAIASSGDDAERAGEEVGNKFKAGFGKGALLNPADSLFGKAPWDKTKPSGLFGTPDSGGGGNPSQAAYSGILKDIAKEEERIEKATRNMKLKGAKGELEERKRLIDEQYDTLRERATASITDEAKRAEAIKKINELSLKAQAAEARKFANEQAKNDESAAARKLRLLKETADDLDRIEAEIGRKETKADPTASFDDRMASRVRAVATEYNKLQAKIVELAQLDKKGAEEAQKKLDIFILQRQELEKVLAKQDELQRLEADLGQQEQLRAARLTAIQTQYDAGLLKEGERLEAVKKVNAEMAVGIEAAGEALRKFATALNAENLIDPTAYQELLNRIDSMTNTRNAERLNAQADLELAEKRLNDLLAERARALDLIKAKQDAGIYDDAKATAETNAANGRFQAPIVGRAADVTAAAEATRTDANKAQVDETIDKMKILTTQTQHAKVAMTELQTSAAAAFEDLAMGGLNTVVDQFAQIAAGQKSAAEGFQAMRDAAREYFADFLRQIAQATIKQAALNAVKAAGRAFGVSLFHSGGVVGSSVGHKRRVDPSYFAGAPRFHSGGLPGLRSDEVPAILQKGEQVLSRDDPNNVLNGGGGGGGGGSTRFVLVDDRAKVAEAMTSAEGERVIVETLRRNIPTLRQYMGA